MSLQNTIALLSILNWVISYLIFILYHLKLHRKSIMAFDPFQKQQFYGWNITLPPPKKKHVLCLMHYILNPLPLENICLQ